MRRKTNQLTHVMLVAGVLSMVLSISLCVGSSLAWFEHTLKVENELEIGFFDATAIVGLSKTRSVEQLSSRDTILPTGAYQLSVHGVGNTSGCVLISLNATQSDTPAVVYRTRQLSGGVICTYEFVLNEETAVSVDPVWGRTRQGTLLEDGACLTYGALPPAEEPQENEQTASTDAEQIDSTETAPPTGSIDTATGDTTATGNRDNTPSTDGTQTTPSTDSTQTTTPAETDTTPTTGSGENTPSTGGGEDTPTNGGEENTPTTDNAENMPATGGEENTPGAGGEEATPPADGTQSTPPADSTPTTTPADSTDTTTGSGEITPATGGGGSTPATDGGEGTPTTGNGDSTPSAGSGDSAPPTSSADGAPTTGADPE